MRNDINDLLTLKFLKVAPYPSTSRNIISVVWRPLPSGWIEINTDGSAQGAPGRMATGGVFRIHDGLVMGCFYTAEGIGFAFLAELLAILTALEWARRLFMWCRCSHLGVCRSLGS
ncbi:hypothetical protein C2S52_011739 [Perilla frutescens var. hirtella]|nr:hypothetical protein C2S52_011739 [Perilla frutescens var. hirtella]